MASDAMCCVSSQNQVLMVKNGQFDQNSNRVEKYSPQIYHVTLIFDVSHPKYVL